MYHSITFGDGTLDERGQFIGLNTWEDWHLIPSSRPDIAIAGVTTNFITLPGMSGSIDQSLILMNEPTYTERSGSLEFYVDNDHEDWIAIYEKIMAALNGKKLKMVLEDDPNYYYEGRFSMNDWKSEANFSRVTINYVLNPYKYYVLGDSELWLWDPFNFETDRTDMFEERRL